MCFFIMHVFRMSSPIQMPGINTAFVTFATRMAGFMFLSRGLSVYLLTD